jgi:hypothetical protein
MSEFHSNEKIIDVKSEEDYRVVGNVFYTSIGREVVANPNLQCDIYTAQSLKVGSKLKVLNTDVTLSTQLAGEVVEHNGVTVRIGQSTYGLIKDEYLTEQTLSKG